MNYRRIRKVIRLITGIVQPFGNRIQLKASSMGSCHMSLFFKVMLLSVALTAICYTTKMNFTFKHRTESSVEMAARMKPDSVAQSHAAIKQYNAKPTNNDNQSNTQLRDDSKKALPDVVLLQIFDENRKTSSAGVVHKCKNISVRVVQSSDINMLRYEAHAVMFNMNDQQNISVEAVRKLIKISEEKDAVNSDMLWIYKAQESAFFVRINRESVRNLPIHIMAGYYLASGIHWLYGHYAPGKPMPGYDNKKAAEESLRALMEQKTKLAVWVASHCRNKNWPRMEFIESIQEHMTVERFGKCGNQTCKPKQSVKCLKEVFNKFKFIISFENSECDDYITEKTWTPLINGIVPVVYGPRKSSYIKQAPPNSFIYAADFNSSKELADYLLYLDKNSKEYLKYFEWRLKGTVKRWNPANVKTYCNVPELIRQVSEGKLKKQPMFQTPFFNSCKPRKEHLVSEEGYLNLTDWEPWK